MDKIHIKSQLIRTFSYLELSKSLISSNFGYFAQSMSCSIILMLENSKNLCSITIICEKPIFLKANTLIKF